MPTVKAQIIPKPDPKRSTILQQPDPVKPFTFIKGGGDTTYICGLCSFKLLESVKHGSIRKIVFKCPKCKSYNYIP